MIKITRAKTSDFRSFYKLFEETLNKGYFLYPRQSAVYILNVGLPKKAQLEQEILEGERPLYVASDNKNVIGYLLTRKVYAGVAFGHWLAVDKNFRNKGIATKLLKVWQQDALSEGAHALQLWTTENDIEFYKKKGFILGGKFAKAWFGLDHFLFYKIIGEPNPKKYVSA